jgi:uncharacterized protein with HEPN domain
MTEELRDQDRIRHMLEAALKASDFSKGRKRSDLEKDEKLTLSLVHLLEILGEAAAKVSPEFRQRHLEIPWNRVTGIRNRLIHGYFDVDLDIVWQTVTNRLPELIVQLRKLVASDRDNI